jgi:branched-chain amino acid transport system substrate-binding protein
MSRSSSALISRRKILSTGTAAAAALVTMPAILRAQTDSLKVGVILPLSGILSGPGITCRKGTELGIKMFADAGTKLNAFFLDTESKPENGRIAAERAIRDGATIVIGAYDSGATISAAQAAEAAKVPLVVNVASAKQITEQGFTQVFRNFPPSTEFVKKGLAIFTELPRDGGFNPKTAVVMHINDTAGQAGAAAIQGAWSAPSSGIKVLEMISYDARARDLSTEVAKAKASGADLFVPITRVADLILIIREMVKQDFSPMGIYMPSSVGPTEKAFLDAVGKYADGILTTLPWYDPTRPGSTKILERWGKEQPDLPFDYNSGFGYESIQIVADAFKRAGSVKSEDLHAALKTTKIDDHPMYGGPIEFAANGQNDNIGIPMLQIQDRKPVIVAPASATTFKPKLPIAKWSERA